MAFELFHLIADPGSARVRRFLTKRQLQLQAEVKLRNATFDEAKARLSAAGGDGTVLALSDGTQLFVGADAAIARLLAHLDLGRAEQGSRRPPRRKLSQVVTVPRSSYRPVEVVAL